MSKKILLCFLSVVAIIMAIMGGSCLSKAFVDDEIVSEIDVAYLEYAQAKDDTIVLAETIQFVGKYHGNVVVTAFRHSIEWVVPAVEVDYYLGDMYICKLGAANHEIIVYTKDKQIKDLKTAYHDGTISIFDLLSLKLALIDN